MLPYLLSILLSSLLDTDLNTVVSLVPGTEWGGIYLDDGVLDKSLCSDQLVVGGIVNNV